MSLPALREYQDEDPVSFYLGAADGELARLADGLIVVEGRHLPVHSAVLGPKSPLLLGLFAAWADRGLKGGGGGGGAMNGNGHGNGNGSSIHDHLHVILSDHHGLSHGLEGFSLKRVAHFLRFCYWPDEVAELSFSMPGAGKTLTACTQLAHRLEVGELMDSLVARMERAVDEREAVFQRLVDWLQVAEQCHLTSLWTKCVLQLAHTLACAREGMVHTVRTASGRELLRLLDSHAPAPEEEAEAWDCTKNAVADCALIQEISSKAQMAILATMVASVRRAPCDASDLLPDESSLTTALQALHLPDAAAAEAAAELAA